MADDPYTALGVTRNATDADIRSTYKRLVKELHPDVNPGDKVSEERFKKVSAAFSILGDAEKRRRFDRGEIDASGQDRTEHPFYRHASGRGGTSGFQGGSFSDFSDVFGDLFGQAEAGTRTYPTSGQDIRYSLDVEFLESATGAKKRIVLPDGGTLDLNVPAGVTNGQTLRLKGKGEPGMGSRPPGDALIEITILPHKSFNRDGLDIWLDLPISIYEAVLGAKIEISTISGRVSVAIPKMSNSGKVLRLKGRGIKSQRSGRTGDQHVRLIINLPDKIDSDLGKMMADWQKEHSYDPRDKI